MLVGVGVVREIHVYVRAGVCAPARIRGILRYTTTPTSDYFIIRFFHKLLLLLRVFG